MGRRASNPKKRLGRGTAPTILNLTYLGTKNDFFLMFQELTSLDSREQSFRYIKKISWREKKL